MKQVSFNELKDLILSIPNNQPILVVGHEMTDYDSIGSCYSLTLFLNKLGKTATYLIEEVDFPKLKRVSTTKYATTSYSEKDYILFILDMNKTSRMGVLQEYVKGAKTIINIDHHEDNLGEADYALVEPDRSATCSILMDLFKLFDIKIDKTIASLLYVGILTDTYCFTRTVNGKTMRDVAELIDCGIDYQTLAKKATRDKTFNEMKALARMVDVLTYDGYHYVEVDIREDVFKGIDANTLMKNLLPELFNISGIDNFVFYGYDGKYVNCLIYSNVGVNVVPIATKFGGGGHKERSGFTTDKFTLEQIKSEIKNYFKNS